jgi:cytidylate kinase
MISIAIDGPSGAGKSTISTEMARRFGFLHIDTGALYRAVALHFSRGGDLSNIALTVDITDGVQKVRLDGKDVSAFIRTPEISKLASDLSALPEIRTFLLDTQRNFSKTANVIMDGRDIGTVVLPNATLKIFLHATPEDRARRRFEELFAKDPTTKYDEVLAQVKERDYNDSHRALAPLKPAEEALIVDTTDNELEHTLELMEKLIRKNLNPKA